MKWFNLKRQRGRRASSKRTGAANRRLGSPFTRRLRFEPMEERRLLSVTIYDFDDLQNMSADLDEIYYLGADIDASGTDFDPVGDSSAEFTGSFYGEGYTISGLTINTSSEAYVGLFGRTDEALLDKVALVDVDIDADYTAGTLHVGGLVGHSTDTDISDSYVTGKLTASSTAAIDIVAGGLVGYMSSWGDSTLDGSYTYCDVEITGTQGNGFVGGLLGYIDGSGANVAVVNSYAMGDVTGSATQGVVAGGLVGSAYVVGASDFSVTLSQSFARGDVAAASTSASAISYAGGLVGSMLVGTESSSVQQGSIEDSYASGTVTATATSIALAGGLTGYCLATASSDSFTATMSITRTYATGDVTASASTSTFAGGLVGNNEGANWGVANINDSFATGVANATGAGQNDLEGGFAGKHVGGEILNGWFNAASAPGLGSGSGSVTPVTLLSDFYDAEHGVYTRVDNNWDFTTTPDWDEFSNTYPRLAYEWSTSITSPLQLQNMQLDLDATYTLAKDIDASQTAGWNWDGTDYEGFDPVGDNTDRFTGSLDGAGYTISGLTINAIAEVYVGLFGFTHFATLDRVALIDVEIDAFDPMTSNYVGGAIGYNYMTGVSDSYVTGTITARTLTGDVYAGGLVGYLNNAGSTTISGSYADCGVEITSTPSNAYAGGLLGYAYGYGPPGVLSIVDSYATGNVTANANQLSYAGGLVSYIEVRTNNAALSRSFATGNVDANSTNSSACAGGLVGSIRMFEYSMTPIYSRIDDAYASGVVTATGASATAGGLVGSQVAISSNLTASITNTYATGSATASGVNSAVAGGLVGGSTGVMGGAANINNSFATGLAVAKDATTNHEGGFAGVRYSGTITNGWWTSANEDAVGSGSDDGITKELDGIREFKNVLHAVYTSNWDFDANGQGAGSNGDWIMAGYPHLQMEWSDEITNVYQLQMMALDLGADYSLANDVDASETSDWNWDGADYEGFDSVGDNDTEFTGSLDGAGHSIRSLKIYKSTGGYAGLFGYTSGASLDNIELWGLKIEIEEHSGMLMVGGLVGLSKDTNISRCFVGGWSVIDVTTTGSNVHAGGLVGFGYGSISGATHVIEKSSAELEMYVVTSGHAFLGGLVGTYGNTNSFVANTSKISESFARAVAGPLAASSSTSGTVYSGGLVGHLVAFDNGDSMVVENSYATANGSNDVTATTSGDVAAGGLIGWVEAQGTATIEIDNCYTTLDATATGEFTPTYAGGFVGRYVTSGTATIVVSDSFATGSATARDGSQNYEGGFAGENSTATHTNYSYWTTESSNSSAVGLGPSNGISRNIVASLTAVSGNYYTHDVYSNWDFSGRDTDGEDDIWDVEGTGVLPTLSWE